MDGVPELDILSILTKLPTKSHQILYKTNSRDTNMWLIIRERKCCDEKARKARKNNKRKTPTNVFWRHSPLPLNRVASACKFTSCSATVLVFAALFNWKNRRNDSFSPPNNCEMPFVLCIPLRSDVYVASLLFFHCSFLRTFFGLLSWFLPFLVID